MARAFEVRDSQLALSVPAVLGASSSIFVLVAWIARTRNAQLGKLILLAVVVALGCMNGLVLIVWQRCRNGRNKKHDGTADQDYPPMHP